MDIDEMIRHLRIRVGGARWALSEATGDEVPAAEQAVRDCEAELAAFLAEVGDE